MKVPLRSMLIANSKMNCKHQALRQDIGMVGRVFLGVTNES